MQTGVQNEFAFKLAYLDYLWRLSGSTDFNLCAWFACTIGRNVFAWWVRAGSVHGRGRDVGIQSTQLECRCVSSRVKNDWVKTILKVLWLISNSDMLMLLIFFFIYTWGWFLSTIKFWAYYQKVLKLIKSTGTAPPPPSGLQSIWTCSEVQNKISDSKRCKYLMPFSLDGTGRCVFTNVWFRFDIKTKIHAVWYLNVGFYLEKIMKTTRSSTQVLQFIRGLMRPIKSSHKIYVVKIKKVFYQF